MNRPGMVLRWASVVIALNIISRFLGFAREVAIAYRFGATADTDAYVVALLVPTIFFVAVREAVRTVFISVYGRYKETGVQGEILVNTVTLALAIVLAMIFAICMSFTPGLVKIIAPGFDASTFATAVDLMRILLPAIFFLGLAGLLSGYLHSHHRFFAPALMGIPFNLLIIISALWGGVYYGIVSLAWGSMIGYITMFLIQLPAVRRVGLNLKVGINLNHPGFRKIIELLPPLLLSSAAMELKQIVDRIFASYLDPGAVAVLNYAERVYTLPYNIFILALITVLYPILVDHYSRGYIDLFKSSLVRGMSVTVYMLLPMLGGLVVLRDPIIRLIYERGAFDAAATQDTAFALMFFSLGLLGLGLRFFMDRAYFVMQDTRTPMIVTLGVVLLNTLLNFLLIGPLAVGGIALSTAIATNTGAVVMFIMLHRRLPGVDWSGFVRTFWRSGVALLIMILALYLTYPLLAQVWPGEGFVSETLKMVLVIAAAGLIYFCFSLFLGITEASLAMRLIGRLFAVKIKNRF